MVKRSRTELRRSLSALMHSVDIAYPFLSRFFCPDGEQDMPATLPSPHLFYIRLIYTDLRLA